MKRYCLIDVEISIQGDEKVLDMDTKEACETM